MNGRHDPKLVAQMAATILSGYLAGGHTDDHCGQTLIDFSVAAAGMILDKVMPNLCPHGNPAGECNDCDVASDFAFDAAREDRVFGRR